MNEIKIFENKEFGKVRTIIINGEPWFVGKDICTIFGDTNSNRSLGRIDESDKIIDKVDTAGGLQNVTLVNESGLYSLLFAMQPQKANKGMSNAYPLETQERIEQLRRFKHWVTSDVLPTIRTHGAYMTNEVIERTLTDPDYLIQLATALKEERQARQLAENKVKTLDNENKILSSEVLEWADRNLINSIVRRYASQVCDGVFGKAWNNFKKELLYKYGINLNSRITKYLNDSGKKTKPKTLDMLDDSEVSDALRTIVSLCRENNVEIGDLLNNTNTI